MKRFFSVWFFVVALLVPLATGTGLAATTPTSTSVSDLVTKGPWVDVRAFKTTAKPTGDAVAASAYAVTAAKALVITSAVSITTTTDLSAAPQIIVLQGGSFSVSGGATLTLPGNFVAPLGQCFTGSGAVIFKKGGVTSVVPQWWGSKGDNTITNEDVYFNKAFTCAKDSGLTVNIPSGSYKVSNTITTWVHFQGAGSSNTILYPQSSFTVFDVQQAKLGRIGGFQINWVNVPGGAASINSSAIGMRLMDSATDRNQQVCFTAFQDIVIRYSWHGIRYDASADINNKGQLYDVSFDHIHLEFCQGDGVYLHTSSGTLSVSLKHVSVDAPRAGDGVFNAASTTAKGFYFFNIANLTLDQCLASGIQHTAAGGSVAKFASCHGIDITSFQHEMTLITGSISATQAPIAFLACEDAQIDVRSQNITFNPGGVTTAAYIYFDTQAKNMVIKSMAETAITMTTGTRKFFTINSLAVGAVNVTVLDSVVTRANCDITGIPQQQAVKFLGEVNTYNMGSNAAYVWNNSQDYTAFTNGESIIVVNQGTPQTLTIPDASTKKGKVLRVHNMASGTATISFGGSNYFAASGKPFTFTNTTANVSLPYTGVREYYSDGTQWVETGLNSYQSATPASATDACKVGQWAADASYTYYCYASNSWRRVAVSSW